VNQRNAAFSLACALLVLACSSQTFAQFLPGGGVDTPDPELPPSGVYLAPDDVHAMYTGADLAIVLTAVQHQPFKDQPVKYDPPMVVPTNELHDFDSDLTATITCEDIVPGACQLRLNGLPPGVPVIGTLDGRVQTVAYNKGPTNTTGTFATEMLGMDLQGFGGMVRIRESPTLPSLGSTRINDNGDGTYHIDSFFDVFTEISLDGGANYNYVAALPTRVDLVVPEPASIGLFAIAFVGIAGVARRRRN
jgi:hypothetical protein